MDWAESEKFCTYTENIDAYIGDLSPVWTKQNKNHCFSSLVMHENSTHDFCYPFSGSRHSPSLWAGTNGGTVYAFCLRIPPAERRMDEPVKAEQGEWDTLMNCI